MSDRLKDRAAAWLVENKSADAKVLTTAEVKGWGPYAPSNPSTVREILPNLLATTRALETAQTALVIAASRSAEEDEARTGYLSLMGKFYEHLELMIRYLEEETSQGDGIAEEHHDGYTAAKALVERTEGLDGLWERAQIAVHELKLELDNALHTFRCIEEDERYQAVVARAEKAEAERDAVAALLDDALVNSEEAIIKANLLERHWRKAIDERNEARAEVARRDALAVSTELMTRTQIDQIRAESKTLVSELVTALAGLERRFLDPTPTDPGGSCWCGEDRPRWLGHEDCCDVARDALAKGAANG